MAINRMIDTGMSASASAREMWVDRKVVQMWTELSSGQLGRYTEKWKLVQQNPILKCTVLLNSF